MNALELRVPPVALMAVAAGLMWVAARAVPSLRFDLPGSVLIAALIAMAGACVAIAGVVHFRRAGTTVNPMTPDASSALVVRGIYRRTRNPMYLGFAATLLGWALYLSNAAALVVLPLFIVYMNRFQIRPEERALEARFGPEFDAYRSSVRRWF